MSATSALHRLVNLWFACSLLLAGLVMRVAAPVVGTMNAPFVNAAVAAGVALVAHASEPGLRSGPVWSLALLTFGGFVLAQTLAGAVGLPAESPAVSACCWVVAFVSALAVLTAREVAWLDDP